MNFGGPGDNGRTSLDALGPIMQSMTDGLYDLISITPRYVKIQLLAGDKLILIVWTEERTTHCCSTAMVVQS